MHTRAHTHNAECPRLTCALCGAAGACLRVGHPSVEGVGACPTL